MAEDTVSIKVQIKNAAKAIADLGGIKTAVKAFSDQVDRSGRSVKTLGDYADHAYARMGRLGSTVTQGVQTLARYSTYAAAAGLAATGFGLKTASGLEQANVSFKALLGSQAAATQATQELQHFAQTTPFNFTGLVDTSQRLLALGFTAKELIPTLTSVGNVAAAMGSGQEGVDRITYALGQIKQGTHLALPEIRQLSESGVNALQILADATGKSVNQIREDITAGIIPGDGAVKVLLAGFDKRFGGLMDQQSNTLAGRWSNLIDTLKSKLFLVAADGTESGILAPLVKILRDNLPAATILAGKAMDRLGVGVKVVVDGVSNLIAGYRIGGVGFMLYTLGQMTGTGNTLVKVWNYLRDVSQSLATIWRTSLYPAIQDLVTILGPIFLGALLAVKNILSWMADNPNGAAAVFWALGTAIVAGGLLLGLVKIVNTLKDIILFARTAAMVMGVLSIGSSAAAAAASATAAAEATAAAATAAGAWKGYRVLPGSTPPIVGVPEAVNKGKGIGSKVGKAFGFAGLAGLAYTAGKAAQEATGGAWNLGTSGAGAVSGFASGGFNPKTQTAWVGERGPELVRLPGGSKVIPNQKLQNMANQGNAQPQIVFQPGALVVNGADYVHTQRLAKAVIGEINTSIARR